MNPAWKLLLAQVSRSWWYSHGAVPVGVTLATLPCLAWLVARHHNQWRRRFLLILTAQIPIFLTLPTALIAWKPAYFLAWLNMPLRENPSVEQIAILEQLAVLGLFGVGLSIPVIVSWSLLRQERDTGPFLQRMTRTFTAISTRVIGMRRGAIVEATPFGVLTIQSGIRSGMIETIRPNAIIGTHGDIALPDESISRRHAQLHIHDNVVMISDLGSRNGTFLCREQHTVPLDNRLHPLRSGDRLVLGDPASANAIVLAYHHQEKV